MKVKTLTVISALFLTGGANATMATTQTLAATFTVIAPLDPVTTTYTDKGLTAGNLTDGMDVGEFVATKTTTAQASSIAVRWTTASGSAADDWKHELSGNTPANKLKVLLDDAKSLGQDRWLDHNTVNPSASSTTFKVKVDGDQTIVADTYAVSLDAASYAP
jgi:hypothetical protein